MRNDGGGGGAWGSQDLRQRTWPRDVVRCAAVSIDRFFGLAGPAQGDHSERLSTANRMPARDHRWLYDVVRTNRCTPLSIMVGWPSATLSVVRQRPGVVWSSVGTEQVRGAQTCAASFLGNLVHAGRGGWSFSGRMRRRGHRAAVVNEVAFLDEAGLDPRNRQAD